MLLFADAFDELTDTFTQFISNVCLSCLILYLCCKFHTKIPNDCQNLPIYCRGILNWATLYTGKHKGSEYGIYSNFVLETHYFAGDQPSVPVGAFID